VCAGTFAYASPEAIMGTKLTLKSDIYSFGIVLLEVRSWHCRHCVAHLNTASKPPPRRRAGRP